MQLILPILCSQYHLHLYLPNEEETDNTTLHVDIMINAVLHRRMTGSQHRRGTTRKTTHVVLRGVAQSPNEQEGVPDVFVGGPAMQVRHRMDDLGDLGGTGKH